ncbi:MAG: hypothetical protein E6750_20610 [Atlantibacter hermannii]|uniref:hypothetical protein n=1 Tax=Atlantibacter hermannii TaxID=565 RepID=UPI002902A625|nr:hypothetical protein [Atlantibacter hermannii]MDU1953781.1 hypothetical protein [Atlantibacter hermannii]
MYPAAMKVFGDMNQDGRSVELTATATDIMWRNVGDTTWKTLCPKSDLKGEPGALSSLIPGTVTTLPHGTQPTITITGTPPNQVLNIGIPAGQSGTNATTTSEATSSTSGLMSASDKAKLDGINSPSASTISAGGRPIGTGFTVSTTRNAWVTYSLSYALTATLALGQNVQISASVNGVEVARVTDGILLGLAGTLNRSESMSFFVPAGKQVLFTKTGTSAIVVTIACGQEVLM